MRILLDADTPIQLLAVLRHVLPTHRVDHVHELGWSSKKDIPLLRDASTQYQVFVTNDGNQFDNPDETAAIRKSRLHHVRYGQRQSGLRGLALAIGAVVARNARCDGAPRRCAGPTTDPDQRARPESQAPVREHRPHATATKVLALTHCRLNHGSLPATCAERQDIWPVPAQRRP